MLYSRLLIPTLKEDPAEAEVISHRLMVRAGMIRKVAAGIYTYLPLGWRTVMKVAEIVRQEMDSAGAQEIMMPAVQPADLWRQSGRWDFYGKELLRFKDRHDNEFCIAPTAEEVITDLVKREAKSYRQLPMNLYQIQTKFRDEIRPRFGLMRGREFIMKDAYSFHKDNESAEAEYWNMYETYKRIFTRCGLNFRAVEADTGNIGGSFSHEFMVLAETGEDFIASCDSCEYAANVEKAECKPPEQVEPSRLPREMVEDDGGELKPLEKVHTPGKKTVEEVAEFLHVPLKKIVKTLIYDVFEGAAKKVTIAVLVRGDHEVNEIKLKKFVMTLKNLWPGYQDPNEYIKVMSGDKNVEIALADKETVERVTGAPSGFAGPVGLKDVIIIADHAVDGMRNFITGGNKADTHFKDVNMGDFALGVTPTPVHLIKFWDLRKIAPGDPCPKCGSGKIEIFKGIEVGHIFMLGTKYSEAMKCTYKDDDGSDKPMIMGCYGIGVGRTAAAAIEQNNDKNGIIWPAPIAPYEVIVLPLNVNDKGVMDAATEIYEELKKDGVEALLDDRDLRAGFKFKDADLIGFPVSVVVGEKNLKDGLVEVKRRSAGEALKVRVSEAACKTGEIINEKKGTAGRKRPFNP